MDNKNLELSQAEMNLLVGGSCQNLMFASDDVNNTNSVAECACSFNNHSAITNTNSADKCMCLCR